MFYIYISSNIDWLYEKKYKYGFTKDPIQRIKNSLEQHSHLTKYIKIYNIVKNNSYILYDEYDKIISLASQNIDIINKLKDYYNYDFKYLSNISKYLVNHDGSSEFIYEEGIELFHIILLNEFKILGLNVTEIDVENYNNEIKNNNEKNTKNIHDNDSILKKLTTNIPYTLRLYQEKIINNIIPELNNNNKCYLELATGGGKSYILYNIINILNPDIILMFSPREIINKQNVSKKYLNILKHHYDIIHNINKNITKKTIIVSCIQSFEKIYQQILKYNIRNIFVWFDEAHWGIEGWIYQYDKSKKFILDDTEYINKRLFTSASPNKNIIEEHKQIFGELISPITVKELIEQKYLCNILPFMFSINKNDPNIIDYNLKGFNENNKRFGFSFHHTKKNAYNLFNLHYIKYINNKTTIKPFLLVSEYNDLDLKHIQLNYNYIDVKTFENNENSIAYVVAQYSMGYDFNMIDIIFLSDPKLSYKDIIQSIGRGMRPDKLGENFTNLNKVLHIYLPVYIEDEINNEYQNIKEVLRYLLYNIGLNFKDINFKHHILNNENGKKYSKKYIGNEEVQAILLELIKKDNYKEWTTKKITKHLRKYNIHNSKDYIEYINNNPDLSLPLIENLFTDFKDFIWINTYNEGECPYYNKKDCIKVIKKLDNIYTFDDDNEKIKYLNNYDNNIPNTNLWRFYGGIRRDYFID
jgi:superfamily II DNA or RNA helicase